MKDFKIIKFLAAIFTPEFNITNSLNIANIANNLLKGKIDGNLVVLPIPQDAPPDIPRVQLTAKEEGWRLDISLARTNLFYHALPNQGVSEILIEEFAEVASNFFSSFKKSLELRVQRLALVTERVCPQENPANYIVEKFCDQKYLAEGRPFNNLKAFEIHSLKKYMFEDFYLNSWVRIKSLISQKLKLTGVLVINDLNTLSMDEDPGKAFSENEISKYYNITPDHLNKILSKYFT